MTTFFVILAFLSTLTIVFLFTIFVSLHIHKNMKGTKLWNFVNKHIIADEDEVFKK